MAQQEFIPYEQALELKELGFDELSLDAYYKTTDGGVSLVRFPDEERQINYPFERIPAPLYQQAFRWFREKYELYYRISGVKQSQYHYSIDHQYKDGKWGMMGGYITTYEEAENACIDKLLEIAKQQDNE